MKLSGGRLGRFAASQSCHVTDSIRRRDWNRVGLRPLHSRLLIRGIIIIPMNPHTKIEEKVGAAVFVHLSRKVLASAASNMTLHWTTSVYSGTV